ncbi:YciI family protein [Thermomonospora cellulosilytica]|uniref:YCII-related domain-containing protein n=1 Tax=Thermomonospora cellulosilytica TaxID=1411118 RepID=A0A7W3MYC7_9ACTN|nr:YciI family protein [Thermomonospora cellulosilytica]MBA9004133.1 hypothetical protein [Thermomonospora cellulosilytica]
MRYLITLNATATPDGPPPAELMEAIAKLGEDAAKAGVLLDVGGLAPSSEGARVTLTGGELTVTDGPFAEAKELISYTVYQLSSKEEAVEWASRFLKLHRDLWPGWEGETEVRRVMGPEDFAPPA